LGADVFGVISLGCMRELKFPTKILYQIALYIVIYPEFDF